MLLKKLNRYVILCITAHPACIECIEQLGMQNGGIKDNQITATSSRPADLPHYGRLHNNKYWCAAKKSKNEYLQVDLGQVRKGIRVF